jgi:hypothetical protein
MKQIGRNVERAAPYANRLRERHRIHPWIGAQAALLALGLYASAAQAVPSFARQTGMACAACHTVYPELTPFGREFKLNGYVIDNLKQIKGVTMERRETLSLNSLPPLSVMLQVSYTHTATALPDSVITGALAKDGEILFPQQASFFYAGKIADNLGAFMQLTYDGAEDHFGFDNTDVRYARYLSLEGDEGGGASQDAAPSKHSLLFGVTLNNNPTVQDPWNTTAAWGFPYSGSSVAPTPNASTKIDSGAAGIGQNAAGIGAYVWLDHAFYAELSAYSAAKTGGAHPLDSTQAAVLKGLAPYWRFGYEHRWDRHSLFLGTYGIEAGIHPGNGLALSGPVDRYTDTAADVQYQFIGDQHLLTVLASYIHENQRLNSSVANGLASNTSDSLGTTKATVEYSYQRMIGGALGVFSTTGSSDALLYPSAGGVAGNANGSPASRGFIAEVNYLPWLNTKLQLQYVGYSKFNGAATNYSGIERNASGNNTLYLLLWLNY